jgi:hypothetical protein
MTDNNPVEIVLSFIPVNVEKHEASNHECPDGKFRHTPAFTAYGISDGHGSYWTLEIPDDPIKGVTIDVTQ